MSGDWLEATAESGIPLANQAKFSDIVLKVVFSGTVTLKARLMPRVGAYVGNVERYRANAAQAGLRIDGVPDSGPIGGLKPFPVSDFPGESHEMVLAAEGSQIGLWIDGQLLASTTDARFTQGGIELVFDPKPDSVPSRIKRIEYGELDAAKTGARAFSATKDAPFVNSLGMEFVPVPGTEVLFCRWETRVKDYRAFAEETSRTVPTPSFAQEDNHPVVNVSWADATAFCAWLSKREGREYRLPTDAEWSTAVGLPKEIGATPKDRNLGVRDVFPWGTAWPPPKGAGNLADESSKGVVPSGRSIDGYVDGFFYTAPGGSFSPNQFGIYDLEGNVLEWCQDWYDPAQQQRVVRGGAFDLFAPNRLWSSVRNADDPKVRRGSWGFRCVVVSGSSSGSPDW